MQSSSTKEVLMRKLSIVATLVALAVAVPFVIGSSHREAPLTSIDPTADDTDVYAYTANDAPGALTIVGNWIPFEDPAGGPNFYGFDDSARYYLNVDNTGDGKPEVRYRFKFSTHVRNKNSFLYAVPQVTSIDDPDLNVRQTYKVERLTYKKGKLRSTRTIASGLPVAPNNVGPKTIPNYDAVSAQATRTLSDGSKVFVGQRDDPFFVDLGTTFDAINFRVPTGDQGGGKDDLAGYAVHSIVLQVPEAAVTRDRKPVSSPTASNAVVGVWGSTERVSVPVLASASKRGKKRGRKRGRRNTLRYVQVSRLGNPLVNEVVIPIGKKDQFNRTTPDRDAKLYGKYVVEPELAKVMNLLFPVVKAPTTNRTDIVQAVLQGIPGLNQHRANPPAVDTIKVNLGTAPAAAPKRLAALAGDTSGYPNGRRLIDDVVDIDLRVVAGALAKPANPIKLGDGVDQNDKPFLSAFPYLAAPTSGFESSLKRIEPGHASE
jgi:uncharacterized protein DUF4331